MDGWTEEPPPPLRRAWRAFPAPRPGPGEAAVLVLGALTDPGESHASLILPFSVETNFNLFIFMYFESSPNRLYLKCPLIKMYA